MSFWRSQGDSNPCFRRERRATHIPANDHERPESLQIRHIVQNLIRPCSASFGLICWRKVGEVNSCRARARHANLETLVRDKRACPARRAPYFVKIAKGLRLGYYRGATAGTWIGRRYLGDGSYETDPLGLADDTTDADGVKVLDYWQAQEAVRRWAERNRLA